MATANGRTYKIRDFITCRTKAVVYMLECPFGIQYMGHISRSVQLRIHKYLSNIKTCKIEHSVTKHFRYVHKRDPRGVKFWGLEKVVNY